MGLRIKILAGYVVLLLLLASIIYLFYVEQVKQDLAKTKERELANVYRLGEKICISLLELSSQAEIASVWADEDFQLYCFKEDEISGTLATFKDHIHTPIQQQRIDSVCLLLNEKRLLLGAIRNTFKQLTEVGEILNEKMPIIVSRVEKGVAQQHREPESPKPELQETAKKKKNFWRIFSRKENKSAYLKAREQESAKVERQPAPPSSTPLTLLRSLNREVTEQQKEQKEKLFLQMDSLYANNLRLNKKLNGLISSFEEEATLYLTGKYRAITRERENSYRIIGSLAAFAFFLVILLYIIIHRDVARRYQYEKELEKSNRENERLLHSKRNMAMSIAHDLRAPIAAIKGCAELLPEEEDKNRQNEYAENIRHSSEYMLALVNTLIDFYLLDIGKSELVISIFRLEVLFKEIAASYSSLAQKKNLQFITNFSGLDALVCGDSVRIQQIAGNLLSNALKFTKQGKVCLQAEYTEGELHLSVQDTGTGMTEEERAKIFNAFERLDNARNLSGFGLGLAISVKLISQMNGYIKVKSTPGQGSIFLVILPLPQADESAHLDNERTAADYCLEGASVLVIDDDFVQLNITKRMLERSRIKCECCENCRDLFTKLREQEYDLILSDIQMPEMDGFGVLELLRFSNIEKAKIIPVLAVTARIDDEKEYTSYGFAGCLHKPFTVDELMTAVAGIIGSKEKRAWEPDFSLILSGEDDKQEMLGIFITQACNDLAALKQALKQEDKALAASILHKNLPLWETLHIDFPLSRLRELATCTSQAWTARQYKEIGEIINAVDKLIEYAKKLREAKL